MPGLVVNDAATGEPIGHLCNASMGQSFAAGTIDGPGMFDFEQGANSSNPLWPFIRDVLHKPTAAETACQSPKDILLPTGNVNFPYPWADRVLPVQVRRTVMGICCACVHIYFSCPFFGCQL